MFAGPLSPGAALIVKSCGRIISANLNRITMKFSTIFHYGYTTIGKKVSDLKSEPRGARGRHLVGPQGIASRLIQKIM